MSFLKIKARNTSNSVNQNINNKKKQEVSKTVQALLGIQALKGNTIKNSEQNKYYIRLQPKNINILKNNLLLNEIQNLKVVCNVADNFEFLVVDKVERLENNKSYINSLLENENDDDFKSILKDDLEFFKELETSKASSREFYINISFKDLERSKQVFENVHQTLDNKNFTTLNCDKDVIKNMLQVYFERNFSGNVVEDFDI